MSEFINTIDVIGDELLTAKILDRTVSEYKDNIVSSISTYTFFGCNNLSEVDLPNVITIRDHAFNGCTCLSTIEIPKVTQLGSSAFNGCTSLTTISIPEITQVPEYAFIGCTSLKIIDLPNATNFLGKGTFRGSGLTDVCFPKAIDIGSAFNQSSNLVSVDLPVATSVGAYAFLHCTKLKTVILRNPDVVCELKNTNAFQNSGVANGTGYIYVPAALVEDYKVATNWSTYAEQIRPLEAIGKFRVRFYNGNTLLQESWYAADEVPIYTGEEPVHEDPEEWVFDGWRTELVAVTGDVDYQVKWRSLISQTRKLIDDSIVNVYNSYATNIGEAAFYLSSNLTTAELPNVTSVGMYAFMQTAKLTKLDLPKVTRIDNEAFNGCNRLTVLILRSETLCTLANTNAFQNCFHFYGTTNNQSNPEGLKDGYIYVPKSLIEDYKVATNWSTFASQFRAIEDYPEICG